MLKKVLMPKLGQTVEEAVIETWHRSEGDAIAKGDVLLEITTDKATLEVESYYAGTVKKLLYEHGASIPVNAVIALIGDAEDEVTDAMVAEALAAAKEAAAAAAAPQPAAPAPARAAPAASAAAPAPAAVAVAAPASAPAVAAAPQALPARRFVSPRARRVAAERRIPLPVLRGTGPNGRIVEADVLGYTAEVASLRATATAREVALRRTVDLTKVDGTGIDGRITKIDVEMAPPAPGTPPSGKRVPLSSMRRIVAERMTVSKTTTPHFYLTIDVDMSKAVQFRRDLMALWSTKVTFNDLLIRGCTLAFQAVPEMNCMQDGDGLIVLDEVNIGLAVAIDGGLVVPVVRRCDLRSVEQISHETARLIERARNKRLTPADYEGGCFTISNLGMFCIETVAPIINPGEVAILGVGRIAPRPVVVGDGIAIRRMTTLTLACDHRLVDGATGARFLKKLKEVLESPERLL